jgi:hypothetical protein
MIDDAVAVTRKTVSRRNFLKSSAASGSTIFLGMIVAKAPTLVAQAVTNHEEAVRIVAPSQATVLPGFLAARLEWKYAAGEAPHNIILSVATKHDRTQPVVHVTLAGSVTTYALPLVPNETYVWRLQPADEQGHPTIAAVQGTFTTGAIRLVQDAGHEEMYKNPRLNARYSPFPPMPFVAAEPLSPWYDVKRYAMAPPPKLEEIKDQLPQPVFDGHPEILETYWYCWKTFLSVWNYAPHHPNHQAVANINGCPTWAKWGSGQVWDSFSMMHYARYGHQAYPFITQFDNAYARQHENGFICQESDNDNFEVYACHPALTTFLIGWAEWDYYQVSGDLQRLRRVFMPLVKNYEWWMTYMRHTPDGTYGFVTPGTRKPCGRNSSGFKGELVEDWAFHATVARAAETLAMARIATLVGRPDMARFFTAEYRRLGDYINQHYWDAEHQLYNDRCNPNHLVEAYRDPQLAGKFITEIKPGVFDVKAWTFFPLFAEIAPPDRVHALVQLVQDADKGFNFPNGIRDSSRLSPPDNIWPPTPRIVQDGFTRAGHRAAVQDLAERYCAAMAAAYVKEGTIRESLNATTPTFSGYPEFVGWGGVGPIANLIEYVLGIDLNVPANTIVWHVHRTERHGLKHLSLGEFYVDLLCDERATADAPCQLTVTSGGTFTLQTVVRGAVAHHRITKGESTLQVG